MQVGSGLPDPDGYILATQDWLHILFRLRVIFLAPHRSLQIGSFIINPNALLRLQKLGNAQLRLLYSDLNSKDKQNYDACLRLFDFKVSIAAMPCMQSCQNVAQSKMHAMTQGCMCLDFLRINMGNILLVTDDLPLLSIALPLRTKQRSEWQCSLSVFG